MEQSDLLLFLCRHLNQIGCRYLITGSHATIAFGEPRFTNDIDVVVKLELRDLDRFCNGFPPEDFYLSRDAALEAIAQRHMFNIIHPASGLMIDVVIPKYSPFDALRLSRGVRVPIAEDCDAVFTSPEDIILQKMKWHRAGGGQRHLDDIRGVLRIQGDKLDRAYIAEQAGKLQVLDLWEELSA